MHQEHQEHRGWCREHRLVPLVPLVPGMPFNAMAYEKFLVKSTPLSFITIGIYPDFLTIEVVAVNVTVGDAAGDVVEQANESPVTPVAVEDSSRANAIDCNEFERSVPLPLYILLRLQQRFLLQQRHLYLQAKV